MWVVLPGLRAMEASIGVYHIFATLFCPTGSSGREVLARNGGTHRRKLAPGRLALSLFCARGLHFHLGLPLTVRGIRLSGTPRDTLRQRRGAVVMPALPDCGGHP